MLRLKSVNDSDVPQKSLEDFGSVSPPDKSLSEEEQHEEPEDDNDDTITITATKEEVIKFIKNNLRQIKRFLTTEENNYLTKETSFAKGSLGSLLTGTGIEEEINEAIKDTLNEMAKANKCFNLTLMLKIFKDLKIPKGNSVKNKTINNLIDKIFGQQSKAIKETEK